MTSGTREPSWALLNRGSAEAFVEVLCAEALGHTAVNHAYLHRLAAGDLPDIQGAIRDYCHQYYFYSAEFTSYLEAVIGGLTSAQHRDCLRHNLAEEQGRCHVAGAEDVPHTELFQRFRRAAGVSEAYDRDNQPITTALIWRDLFLQKCQSRQAGVGVGAIGIGTELVVSRIYHHLHTAVATHTAMVPDDYLFLSLHMECDDEHAEDLKRISVELAEAHELREALRFGVLSSLNLRNAFWDVMLGRALAAKPA
ncbi:iron-containing redox enzyme family protein [bacterium]|nr:iron-containing redox enzyme family protein [bacterium]